jgi:hypothetical protein
VFGWVVAFGKAVVGCDFQKSSFDKAVVGWLEARLVELLWLLEKSHSLTSRPHMLNRYVGLLLPLASVPCRSGWCHCHAGRGSPSASRGHAGRGSPEPRPLARQIQGGDQECAGQGGRGNDDPILQDEGAASRARQRGVRQPGRAAVKPELHRTVSPANGLGDGENRGTAGEVGAEAEGTVAASERTGARPVRCAAENPSSAWASPCGGRGDGVASRAEDGATGGKEKRTVFL